MPATLFAFAESAHDTSTTPKTVSLTVAVGDILVVAGVTSDPAGTLTTPTGGTGFTWTLQQSSLVAGTAGLYLWTTTATAAQTFTLSVARGGTAKTWGFYVKQWRGATGIGVSGKATSATAAAPSLTITTTGSDSILDVTFGDWNASATAPTYRTTGVGSFTQQAWYPTTAASGNYTVVTGYYGSPGVAGSKTVGATAPNMAYAIAAVEILGPGGTSVAGVDAPVSVQAPAGTVSADASVAGATAYIVAVSDPGVQSASASVPGVPAALMVVAAPGQVSTVSGATVAGVSAVILLRSSVGVPSAGAAVSGVPALVTAGAAGGMAFAAYRYQWWDGAEWHRLTPVVWDGTSWVEVPVTVLPYD